MSILVFTVMINFCIKTVHSLLYFNIFKDNGLTDQSQSPGYGRSVSSPASGLSFITLSGELQTPTNVVEAAAIKSQPSSPAAATAGNRAGGIGFLDEVGGTVDGLTSCTESLGFESSDERSADDQIESIINCDEHGSRTTAAVLPKWKRTAGKREVKKFPPPLSSLNQNGRPTFYLLPVRKDGRLELTGVKIDQIEILRASREDGRLRLYLIRDIDEEEEEEEEEEAEEEKIEEETLEDEEEKERGGKWQFPVTSGGGEGFRRCYELVRRHHHNNLQAWSQHCVTIR